MPDPRDPDTEDRRNDRDLDEKPGEREPEPGADIDEVVVDFELFDNDDSILVDFDLDDLRDMKGPNT